jgi:hypothetical protein
MKRIIFILGMLWSLSLGGQNILLEGGKKLPGATTTGQVPVYNSGTGTWSAGTDQNGIYLGSGTVPNGTTATLANDFTFAGTDNTGNQDPALRVTATGTNPGIVSFIVSTDSMMLSRVSGEFREVVTDPFRLQADGITILSNDGLTLQGDSLTLIAGVSEDIDLNTVLTINTATNRVHRKPMHLSQTVSGSSTIVASRTVVYVNNIAASATITLADPTTNVNCPVTIARYDATSTGTITITSSGTPLIEDPTTFNYGSSITLGTSSGDRRVTLMSDGTRYHVLNTGGGGGGGSSSTTLDDAYNNFGATASKITVDAAESQTGGLEFETSGANDFTVDMQGTGDFVVQDAGTAVFRVLDNGRASFGNIAPSTSQRLVVAEDGASSVSTPIRADNGATVTDNGGTQLAIAYNGFDRLVLKAYNPSGSYINAASLETTSGANITVTDDIRETRFNAAIAREVTTGTATTYQVDGRTSFVRIPTSATTTTITLPEIVTGAATTNQVNVGYELYLTVNRSVAVTINRAGSDVFVIDGVTGSSTSLQTTANIVFAKKLIASDANEWTIVQ